MPPTLALLLCTAFVLFILVLERRTSPGVSAALWIPTLWMLTTSSKPLAIWFNMTGSNESGSILDQLALAGLMVGGMVVLARRRLKWSIVLRQHAWLLVLLTYMLVSTLWSDITLIALRRWARELIVVIMALVILTEANPKQALEGLLRRTAYIFIPFSLTLIMYYPTLGREYARWSGKGMWIGVTVQKNMLGRVCMMAILFLFWALWRRWCGTAPGGGRFPTWADVSILVIALFLLRGDDSYSASSIATLAVGIASFLGLLLIRKLRLPVPQAALLVLVMLLVGMGVSAPFLGGSNVAFATSVLGRDETLTGRTGTWAALVPVFQQNPFLGIGFGSFWTTARRDFYEMSFAHNGYLDVLLQLGAVGLASYTVWLLSCASKLFRALVRDYEWASLAISILLMVLVYNVTESALDSLAEQMTATMTIASMVVPFESTRAIRRSYFGRPLHVAPQRVA